MIDHEFEMQLTKLLGQSGKIFFFDSENQVEELNAQFLRIEKKRAVVYLDTTSGIIQADQIITIIGKPGPAFAQYEAYANACLSCDDSL